jgi:hypothetical protein
MTLYPISSARDRTSDLLPDPLAPFTKMESCNEREAVWEAKQDESRFLSFVAAEWL